MPKATDILDPADRRRLAEVIDRRGLVATEEAWRISHRALRRAASGHPVTHAVAVAIRAHVAIEGPRS